MNSPREISQLQPQGLWRQFQKICDIPHPSGKEAAIIAAIKQFGDELGLETQVDQTGNLILRKPATPGMENRRGIILQGHVDMVTQKNQGTEHDFDNDPIQPWIDGDWVKAKGTTLGADNGIGAAAALAIMESTELPHGPLEVLLTIDEERSMRGAEFLEPGILQGDLLFNLDHEEDGELCAGCAGGVNTFIEIDYQEEPVPEGHQAFEIALTGLTGGHSGNDIHRGRGNANKLTNRFLRETRKAMDLRVARMDGGSADNAIPREAFTLVTVPGEHAEDFLDRINTFEKTVRGEIGRVEQRFSLIAKPVALPDKVMDNPTLDNLIRAVYACFHGLLRMSDEVPGVVETSNNLAIVKAQDGKIEVVCFTRSAINSARDSLAESVVCAFELMDARIELKFAFSGWQPNMDSEALKLLSSSYEQLFGEPPAIKVVHAGLECGLLADVYPHWELVSFGPTIHYAHSPDEKVHIPAVEKFWQLLTHALANAPAR